MKVSEILALSEPEADPDLEGARLLLAGAVSLLPSLSLDELLTVAPELFSELGRFDRDTLADVARRLGVE